MTKKILVNSVVPVALIAFIIVIVIISCSSTDEKSKEKPTPIYSQKITCYSGGKLIYDGESIGNIFREAYTSSRYFKEKPTGQTIIVNGDCVIRE